MCFTPAISLTTAIVEFILAAILMFYFPKKTLRNLCATTIFLLGFYQFAEFLLCTTGNPILWAKWGFIAYSFLPAIALHTAMKFTKQKPNYSLIYAIPVLASIFAIIFPIVLSATCHTFFVEVHNVFNQSGPPLNFLFFSIYCLYYFGFTFTSSCLFYMDFRSNKNKTRRKIDITEILGVLLMTIPTLLFVIILPYMAVRFPSVLCSFAIFVAISAFIAVYLESKIH